MRFFKLFILVISYATLLHASSYLLPDQEELKQRINSIETYQRSGFASIDNFSKELGGRNITVLELVEMTNDSINDLRGHYRRSPMGIPSISRYLWLDRYELFCAILKDQPEALQELAKMPCEKTGNPEPIYSHPIMPKALLLEITSFMHE